MNYDAKPCPTCSGSMAPVLYGYPTTDMIELARQDMIALGGCIVGEDKPTHYCYSCNETYKI